MLGPFWTIKMQTVLYTRRLILYFHICKSTTVCLGHHALVPSKWCHIRITYQPINIVRCKWKRYSTSWLTENFFKDRNDFVLLQTKRNVNRSTCWCTFTHFSGWFKHCISYQPFLTYMFWISSVKFEIIRRFSYRIWDSEL